ncbi:MAG TPA: hypothetical protein VFX97_14125 [Pyrinomonadaceae bacterium]|nr:hypothetical protein [Pyrinomonadaceae bacterium]
MKAYIFIAATLVLTFAPAVGRVDAELLTTAQAMQSAGRGNLDPDSQIDIYQRALAEESADLNLENLSKSRSKDEVRLWVGFGLITPRLFVLRREGGIEKATYYSTEPNPDKTARPRTGIKVVLPLESPRSGWKDFRTFLKQNGVGAPLKLTSDSESLIDPDSEAIVIEVKSARGYEMVFFTKGTKTADGRKAVGVCQQIESEFKVRMGC